jgi:putative DNA primase/helicase
MHCNSMPTLGVPALPTDRWRGGCFVNTTPSPLLDPDEIEHALAVLVAPEQAFEIRILNPHRAGRNWQPKVTYGYFDNPDLVVEALTALRLDAAKGIYITLNPIEPTLLARSHNRFSDAKTDSTTPDKYILSRRWLLVDFDPVRPAEISASDEEKAHAYERCQEVAKDLWAAGWPPPVIADSGNGYHHLYRVNLPADDNRVKRCLQALDLRFSDASVKVDTAVFNPSRIVKLYGTKTMKGDNCPDLGRPHRMSRILEVPDEIEAIPVELLDAMAGGAVEEEPQPTRNRSPSSGSKSPWDKAKMEGFISRYLSQFDPGPATPYADGWKWVLRVCPFDPAHDNGSAVIIMRANGTLGFRCQHDSCQGKNWKALRAMFDPKPDKPARKETPTVTAAGGDEELIARCGPPILLDDRANPSDINQMFVAARHKRDNLILFEPSLTLFYCYDEPTGLWKPKTESRVVVEMGDSLPALLDTYEAAPLLRKRSESFMSQVLRFLKGMAENAEAFQHREPIIHVGNGVIHLNEDPPALHEFSPAYYSRNRSEIRYEPNAICPRFLDELLGPALPEDDISLLQRYAGLCLLGGNPAQRFLILRGTAGGGKSTLVEVLETIIGPHNVGQLRVHLLTERFEIAGFLGKTLLCGKDVPGDFLDNRAAHVLKPLTGGDRLSAEQKNVKHRFEVTGDFAVIITTNSRLHVRLDSDTEAWRRRMLIIDFTLPPTSKPIPHFARELVRTEGPGILNWCIDGAVHLLAELREHGRIQLTQAQKQRVDALLCESDSVRHFVTHCVSVDPTGDVTVAELLTAYNAFCAFQGWQAVTVRQFESQVCDHMVSVHRAHKRTDIRRNDKNQRGYARVSLQEAGSVAPAPKPAQSVELPF